MHEQWTDQLSDFLDGDLPPARRAELYRHLAECESCSAVLEDLRAVVARAAQLGALPPEQDLWPEIAARIEHSPLGPRLDASVLPLRPRRKVFPLRQLAAASVVLLALSAGALWFSRGRMESSGPLPSATAPLPGGGAALASQTDAPFGETSAAIRELERAVAESRARLNPETLRVIDENLALIDSAIADIQRALAEDPASTYLNLHMADTMQRKLQLLRDMDELAARAL